MNRLETEFGNDGSREDNFGDLRPFGARYRFSGRTWAITVWAVGWQEARKYCRRHGLTLDGEIVGIEE